MNDNAKKWIEALKSGKYQQCRLRLSVENAYCCLGVACEVYIAEGNPLATRLGSEDTKTYANHMDDLPDSVVEWLGLRSAEGHYQDDSLAALNDGGMTFSEIAAIIESNPEGLFVDDKAKEG